MKKDLQFIRWLYGRLYIIYLFFFSDKKIGVAIVVWLPPPDDNLRPKLRVLAATKLEETVRLIL